LKEVGMAQKYKVTAVVTGLKGRCTMKHKVGDVIELSPYNSGGLCGFFYHDIYPALTLLQYGGKFPWMQQDDVYRMECPDRSNCVEIELRRERI
jgi:uncharacterized repeat protein (TIGR04076 family)